jgi:hypothetical protein
MYVAAFAIGFGPIPWVMNVELFPKEARVSIHPHPNIPKCSNLLFRSTDTVKYLFFVAAHHLCSVHHLQLDVLLPRGQPYSLAPGS